MADSNYSVPLQSAFSIAPTPPALRPPQDAESFTTTPSYSSYNPPYLPHDLPTYNPFPPPMRIQLPEPYGGVHNHHHNNNNNNNNNNNGYQQNRHHQFPFHGGPRMSGYHAPPSAMFQHNRSGGGAASNLAPNHLHHHSLHMAGSPHPDFAEPRSSSGLLPMMDSSLHGAMPSYTSPPLPQWSTPSLHEFHRHATSHMPGAIPPFSGRFASDAMRTGSSGGGENRGPIRRLGSGTAEMSRHMTSPARGTLYERQHQQSSQQQQQQQQQQPLVPPLSERRLSSLLGSPTRRPNRSLSPRTSNRRSFDRYSTDISQSGNPPDTNDAAQTHTHRARRPRMVAPSAPQRQRYIASHDPNIPTTTQMQALKDKLRHFLPSELPEDASSTCDICQKDYSEKHVLPSENEEVAIQLPCKHVFGEHCINTWFETCKTHKNKITCPMCRKLLIEPQRPSHSMLQLIPSDDRRRHIYEAVMTEGDRHLLESLAARELEGDFDHA